MPRLNDVFSLLSGSKGVPNTTIQSNPYNSQLDDFAADANAARPITAGGTGATNATTARTNLGANNAGNLTAGTVADARLPASMASKSFTGTTIFLGGVNVQSPGIELGRVNGTAGSSFIDFHTGAAVTDYDSRIIASGGNGSSGNGSINVQAASFTFNGDTIWTSGNGGPGSGLDADTLDGIQASSFVQTSRAIIAGNGLTGGGNFSSDKALTLGTPTTITGATTNTVTATSHTHNLDITPAQLIAFLGYTPVQQGGSIGQGNNKVYIGLTAGSTLSATVDATNLGKIWTDSLSPTNLGSGFTTLPNGLMLQAATTVVTTNASGDGSISFPSTFPNLVNSCVAVIGDSASPATTLKVATPVPTTGFNFRAVGAPSQAVRVNWIAYGR